MDIEKLTRFLPACSLEKVPMPIMIQTLEEDSYVRFLDVKEASSNSLQQLKAEIRSVVGILNASKSSGHTEDIEWCVNRLRELSAV